MPPVIEFVWEDGRERPLVYCTPATIGAVVGTPQPRVEKTKFRLKDERSWKAHRPRRWK